jgi:hypothetical protein
VTGTSSLDGTPTLVLSGSAVHLAFTRSGGQPGVYLTSKPATAAWRAATRLSTSSVDAAQALAVDRSGRDYLVFTRG